MASIKDLEGLRVPFRLLFLGSTGSIGFQGEGLRGSGGGLGLSALGYPSLPLKKPRLSGSWYLEVHG